MLKRIPANIVVNNRKYLTQNENEPDRKREEK